jgi:hypothetical protein
MVSVTSPTTWEAMAVAVSKHMAIKTTANHQRFSRLDAENVASG